MIAEPSARPAPAAARIIRVGEPERRRMLAPPGGNPYNLPRHAADEYTGAGGLRETYSPAFEGTVLSAWPRVRGA